MAQVIVEIVVRKDELKAHLDADNKAINTMVESLKKLGTNIDQITQKTLDIGTGPLEQKLTDLQTRINSLTTGNIKGPTLDLDTKSAITKLETLESRIKSLANTDETAPSITVNTKSARDKFRFLRDKTAELDNMTGKGFVPKITVTTQSARDKLNFLRKKIREELDNVTGKGTVPSVTLNVQNALDQIDLLLAQVREFRSQSATTSQISLTSERARRQLTHLIGRLKTLHDRAAASTSISLSTETASDSLVDLISLLTRLQTDLNKVNVLNINADAAQISLRQAVASARVLRETLDNTLRLNLETRSARDKIRFLKRRIDDLNTNLAEAPKITVNTESARAKINFLRQKIKDLETTVAGGAPKITVDTESARGKITHLLNRLKQLREQAAVADPFNLDTTSARQKVTHLLNRVKTLRENLQSVSTLALDTESARNKITALKTLLDELQADLRAVNILNLDTEAANRKIAALIAQVRELQTESREGLLLNLDTTSALGKVRRLKERIEALKTEAANGITLNLDTKQTLEKLTRLRARIKVIRTDLETGLTLAIETGKALTELNELQTRLAGLRSLLQNTFAVQLNTEQARGQMSQLTAAVTTLRDTLRRGPLGTAQINAGKSIQDVRRVTSEIGRLRTDLRTSLGSVQIDIKAALARIQDLKVAVVLLRADLAQGTASQIRLDTGPALAAINDLKTALVLLRADIAQSGAGRVQIETERALADIRTLEAAIAMLRGNLARGIQGGAQVETERAEANIRRLRATLNELQETLRQNTTGTVQVDTTRALANIRDLKVALVLLRADFAQGTSGTVLLDIDRALASIRDLKAAMVLLRADLARGTFGSVQIETERAQSELRDLQTALLLLRANISERTLGTLTINTQVAMGQVRDLNIAVALLRTELQGVLANVTLNAGPAEKELRELRGLVETLKTEITTGLTSQIRFDTSAARAEARAFMRRLEDLQSDLRRTEAQAKRTAEALFNVSATQGSAAAPAAAQTPALASANAGAAATSAATGVAALTAQFAEQGAAAAAAAVAIRQYRLELTKLIFILQTLRKEKKETDKELERPVKPGTDDADKGLKDYRKSQRRVTEGFREMSRVGKRAFDDIIASQKLAQLGALTRTGGTPINTGPIFQARVFQENFAKAVKNSNQVINEQRALLVRTGPPVRSVGNQFRRTARDVEGYSKAVQRANIFSKEFVVTSIRFGLAGTVAFQIISMIEALRRLPGVLQTAAAEFQNMQARIQLFNETQLGTTESMNFISQTALKLGGDLTTLRESYAGLLPFVKNYQLTTLEAREIIEGFALAQKTAGVSNDRAREALFQLRQALGASSVEFEELRVILEAFPGLERVLADELGVISGRLKDLTKTGELAGTTLAKALPEALRRFSEGAEDIQTLQQEISRTKNEFQLLAEVIGNRLSPQFEALNRAAQGIARFLRTGFEVDEDFAIGFRNLTQEAEGSLKRLRDIGGFEGLIRQIEGVVEDARLGIISLNEAQRLQRQIAEEAITLTEQRIRLARELKEVQAERRGEAEDSPTSFIANLKKQRQALREQASEQKKLATARAADLQRQVQAEKKAADEILSIRLRLIEQERDIQFEIADLQRQPLRARADIDPEDRRRSLGAELEIMTRLREAREQLANVAKAASKDEQVIAKDAAEAAIQRARDLSKDIVDRNQQIFLLKQVAQVQKALLEQEKAGQEALREQSAKLADEAVAASIKAERAAKALNKQIKDIGGTKASAELELKENNIIKRIAEIDAKLKEFREAQAEFTIEGRFIDNTPEASQRIVDLARLIQKTQDDITRSLVIPGISKEQKAGLEATEAQLKNFTQQLIGIRKSNLLPETGLAQLNLLELRLNQINLALSNLGKPSDDKLKIGVSALDDTQKSAVALQAEIDALQLAYNEVAVAAQRSLSPENYVKVRDELDQWQQALNGINRQLATGLTVDGVSDDFRHIRETAEALRASLALYKKELDAARKPAGENKAAVELQNIKEEAEKANRALREPLKLEVLNAEDAKTKIGEFTAEILNSDLALENLKDKALQGVDVKTNIEKAETDFDSLRTQLDAILARAEEGSQLKMDVASALADLDLLRERLLDIKRIAASIRIPSGPGTATAAPGFNRGGYIPEDGSPNRDTVLGWLTTGEYILPRNVVRAVGLQSLEALRTLTTTPQQIIHNAASNVTNRSSELVNNIAGNITNNVTNRNSTLHNSVVNNLTSNTSSMRSNVVNSVANKSSVLRTQRVTQINRAVAPGIAWQQFNAGGLVGQARQNPAGGRDPVMQNNEQPINLTLDLGTKQAGPFPIRANRSVADQMIRELTAAARSR